MTSRVNVLGVHVTPGTLSEAVEKVADWIKTDQREYVCITGVHGVIESQDDPALLAIHNASGMTTTDGMPLVWCAHRAGFADAERVYGPDLMLAICERAAKDGWSSYFYGAGEGVADRLATEMESRFAGFVTAGALSPPFRSLSADEEMQIADDINATNADIVWVGLSTPKQERWMAANRDRLDAAVLIGVGAAFDFHTGGTKQAPKWMQRSGLEWFFRLATEPRRLWKRYFTIVPRFLVKIIRRPPTRVADRS